MLATGAIAGIGNDATTGCITRIDRARIGVVAHCRGAGQASSVLANIADGAYAIIGTTSRIIGLLAAIGRIASVVGADIAVVAARLDALHAHASRASGRGGVIETDAAGRRAHGARG